MCSRHAELNGAGSDEDYEPPRNTVDMSCDYCGRVMYATALHPIRMAGTVSYYCDRCRDRWNARYDDEMAS